MHTGDQRGKKRKNTSETFLVACRLRKWRLTRRKHSGDRGLGHYLVPRTGFWKETTTVKPIWRNLSRHTAGTRNQTFFTPITLFTGQKLIKLFSLKFWICVYVQVDKQQLGTSKRAAGDGAGEDLQVRVAVSCSKHGYLRRQQSYRNQRISPVGHLPLTVQSRLGFFCPGLIYIYSSVVGYFCP